MLKLQIKKELLPTRCEVCHQKDLFDAKRNVCFRCNDKLVQPPISRIQSNLRSEKENNIIRKWKAIDSKTTDGIIGVIVVSSIFIIPRLVPSITIASIIFGYVLSIIVLVYKLCKAIFQRFFR